MTLERVITPQLLLDRPRLRRNLSTMASRIGELGARLRPHVKTHKSIDVWREVKAQGAVAGMTVSTLAEARYFWSHGERDIFYAVGIAPNKFDEAAHLIREGCGLSVTLDNVETALALSRYATEAGVVFPVVVELDVDGHRSGVDPKSDRLLAVARALTGGTELEGVMTHAGESYACTSHEELARAAANERDLTVLAANRLREAGFDCRRVSIGSTPTASVVDDLAGITEVRPGVYTFFDLVMRGIGVCRTGDIALSVLAAVTGHQRERGWVITDAGWMAMSGDRGSASPDYDFGYGEVCDLDGNPIDDLSLVRANQEHGVIGSRCGGSIDFDAFPIGRLVRVLPNHACATAGQFDRYVVLDEGEVVGEWERTRGW
jgi:D-serine deaminase-like pyridoxal phosphate-dependent protein